MGLLGAFLLGSAIKIGWKTLLAIGANETEREIEEAQEEYDKLSAE